jgi:hypothetical protein
MASNQPVGLRNFSLMVHRTAGNGGKPIIPSRKMTGEKFVDHRIHEQMDGDVYLNPPDGKPSG